jgi:hypothetical protein
MLKGLTAKLNSSALFVILLAAACSPAAPPGQPGGSPPPQGLPPPDNPVPALTTIVVLATCLLPIVMAVIGAVTMRVLSWLTRPESTEDEVVPAPRTLPAGIHLPAPTIWPAVLGFGLMGLMFAIAFQSWIVLALGALFSVLGLMGWVVLEVKEFRLGRRR